MVRRPGMLVALQPDQVHGDLPSLRRLHTVWCQEPSGGKDGRLPATLRGEGATHRLCDNCINIGLGLQHVGSYSKLPRSTASRYTSNLVERLYEKSSNASQPPRHEANHGSIYERFAART